MALDHDAEPEPSAPLDAYDERRRIVGELAATWRQARSGEAVEALRRYVYGSGEHRLEIAQVRALEAVVSMGSCRLRELASRLGVQPSTASRVVTRLVDKELVERVGSTDDRRTVRITPTPAGREVLAYFWRRAAAAHRAILVDFTDDEVVALTAVLDRLLAATADFARHEV